MKKILMVLAVGAAGLASAAESGKEGEGCAHDHAESAHGASVEVSASAARAMGLKTVRPEKRRMRTSVPLMGRLELAPDARWSAASPLAGRVSLKVRSLALVSAGETLFTVESPELRAKEAEIGVLERRIKVYRDLKRASADLEAQLVLRQAERAALRVGAEAQDGVVSVKAAQDGRVEALAVTDGAWVSSGTAVVEAVRPDRVRFVALVAASEAARMKDGQKVLCGTAVGALALGFGDASGLTPVYAVFDQGLTARPGERLQVECVTDERETPVAAVPTASVVRIGLEPTVFVRDEHERDRFVAVKVALGLASGGWTEVTGLPEDENLEVVREGAYELKIALSTQSGAAPAGHFHADGTFHEGTEE